MKLSGLRKRYKALSALITLGLILGTSGNGFAAAGQSIYGAGTTKKTTNSIYIDELGNLIDVSTGAVVTANKSGSNQTYVSITSGDLSNGNNFTVAGGTWANIYGGSASSNVVTVKNSTVTGEIRGGNSATTSSSNSVSIENSTVGGTVYGGYATDTFNGNNVTITNSTIGTESVNANVYGSYKSGTQTSMSYGGTVTITNSTIWGNVWGVWSRHWYNSGSSKGVSINGNTKISGSVYGAENNTSAGLTINYIVTIKSDSTGSPQITGDIIGGWLHGGTSNERAYDNKVYIYAGSIGGKVIGSKSGWGTSGNWVEIGGGTLGGQIYSGYTEGTGEVKSNNLKITGGTIKENAYAGYKSKTGAAYNNTTTITGGTIEKNVYGGYTAGAGASLWTNNVNISGGNVEGTVYASYAEDADITTSNVKITGGKVNNVWAAYSKTNRTVYKNHVEISGASTEVTGNIFGGNSQGKVGGSTDWANTITVTGGTIGTDEGSIAIKAGEGWGSTGDITYNTVSLTGGTYKGTVNVMAASHPITASTGVISNNSVTINNVGTLHDIYGAKAAIATGNIYSNSVSISGASTSITGNIYGGYSVTSDVGILGSDGATKLGNTVTINGGAVSLADNGVINAGYTEGGNANYNVLTISGATITSGTSTIISGGRTDGTTAVNATGNTISIGSNSTTTSITAYEINGGRTLDSNADATVTGNSVTINGDNTTINAKVYGGHGGGSFGGAEEADGNIVTINGGKIGTTGSFYVIGAEKADSNAGDVINNKVIVTGGEINAKIYGGSIWNSGSTSKVQSNAVSISGSATKITGLIYGGVTNGSGTATLNTVAIDDGAVTTTGIYGGYSNSGIAGGTSGTGGTGFDEANSVAITGGTITLGANGGIYGGYSVGSLANYNKITISGGTIVGAEGTTGQRIAGGRSSNGGTTGNAVTINKGTVNATIYGGLSETSTGNSANRNTVEINSDTNEVISVTGNIYGGWGYNASQYDTVTIGGSNTTIQGEIYGAYTPVGHTMTGDTITINGGTITGNVIGSYAPSNNSSYPVKANYVYFYGGTVTGNIIGGMGETAKGVFSNVVTLGSESNATAAAVIGNVYVNAIGSVSTAGVATVSGDVSTTGTLNVSNYGNTVSKNSSTNAGGSVYAKGTTIKFTLPEADIQDDSAMLTVEDTFDFTSGSFNLNYNTASLGKLLADSDRTVTLIGAGTALNSSGVYKLTRTDMDDDTAILYTSTDGATHYVAEVYDNYVLENTVKLSNNTTDHVLTVTAEGSVIAGIYTVGGNSAYSKNSGTAATPKLNLSGAIDGASLYAGAYSDAAASNSTTTITDGVFDVNIYGGYTTGTGDVTGNKIIIEGGTFGSSADTTRKDVYGAYTSSSSGTLTTNSVSVTDENAQVYYNIYGAWRSSGTVGGTKMEEANVASISNGNVQGDVYGAYTGSGTVKYNKVTISGGTIGSSTDTTNKKIYGGYTAAQQAAYNQVDINGGTVYADVYGGYSNSTDYGSGKSYTVNNNIVTIDGSDTRVIGTVYGAGKSNGFAWADVNNNEVYIKGGAVTGNVIGASSNTHASTGTAEYNKVYIYGGTVTGNVIGGYGRGTGNDGSRYNYVILGNAENADAKATVVGNVYINAYWNTSNNSLQVGESNGWLNVNNYGNTVSVNSSNSTGGNVYANGAALTFTLPETDVSNDSVMLTAGTKAYFEGSTFTLNYNAASFTKLLADSDKTITLVSTTDGISTNSSTSYKLHSSGAMDNVTIISGADTASEKLIRQEADYVVLNSLTLAKSTDSKTITLKTSNDIVAGAYIYASGTIKSTNSGDKYVLNLSEAISGATIYAGVYSVAAADNSQTTVKGGTYDASIYGGYTTGTATEAGSNEVKIGTSDSTEGISITGDVQGGHSASGTVSGNTINIGAVGTESNISISGKVEGANAGSGNATNNNVYIYSGTIGSFAAGGHGTTGDNNHITISGDNTLIAGQVGHNIGVAGSYVGRSSNGNTVTISGGQVGTESANRNVYGAYSDGSDSSDVVTNNTVTITGGKIYGNISGANIGYGSGSSTGKSYGNTVTLGAEEAGSSGHADITGSVYINSKGGKTTEASGITLTAAAGTGTLNVYNYSNTVAGNIYAAGSDTSTNKSTVNFTLYDASFNGKTMLSANTVNFSNAAFTLKYDPEYVFGSTSSAVTLVSATSSISGPADYSLQNVSTDTTGKYKVIAYTADSKKQDITDQETNYVEVVTLTLGQTTKAITLQTSTNIIAGVYTSNGDSAHSTHAKVDDKYVLNLDGTVTGAIYAGAYSDADAIDSITTVSAGNYSTVVYGGYSTGAGNVNGNIVNVGDSESSTGPTLKSIYSGYMSGAGTSDNSISGNTLNVNGKKSGSTWSTNISGQVFGGYVNNTNSAAAVTGNVVVINGGKLTSSIYGGYSTGTGIVGGDAAEDGNTITINGGEINATSNLYLNGGESTNGSAVKYNKVTINDGTFGGTVHIRGGNTESGNGAVSYNSVELNKGTITGIISGGRSKTNSSVNNNWVMMTGGTTKNYVYGGFGEGSNDVSSNSITVSGGTTETWIYGGYSESGVAGGDTDTLGNRVTIEDGATIYAINGGESASAAKHNQVVINGGSVSGEIRGGSVNNGTSVAGTVTGNSVTINGGTMSSAVKGGRSSGNSAVSENSVNITAGKIGNATTSANVYGGMADNAGTITLNFAV